MIHDIHSRSYAEAYLQAHDNPESFKYRRDYWNHFLLDALMSGDSLSGGKLLEEGGGTCGIWNALRFSSYTSADISEEMNRAAKQLHEGHTNRNFVQGDIFSPVLQQASYSAIVANAFGIYYRPDLGHLQRFYDLLQPGGMVFVSIDEPLRLKHWLVAPFAALINRHIRPYMRVSAGCFRCMSRKAGFRIFLDIGYEPAPGWKRRAFILHKPD